MAQFYKQSGIVPLRGLVQTVFAGVGTAISLGIAYAYASVYIPFVYVHILLTGAFGLVLGLLVKQAARAGRIRNRTVPGVIGLASGLVGLYFAWGGDFLARKMMPLNVGFFLAFRPQVIWWYMQWAYENGLWELGKHANGPLKGIPLAMIWVAEAAIIVGLAAHFPWNEVGQWVFCESCGWWETIETNLCRFSAENADSIAARIKEEDLSVLGELVPVKPDNPRFLRTSVTTCETCDESNYLDLERVTLTVDKKGNVKTRAETLVDKMEIAAADVPLVLNAGKAPPEAPRNEEQVPPEEVVIDPSVPEHE
jgi:hypothetical protein